MIWNTRLILQYPQKTKTHKYIINKEMKGIPRWKREGKNTLQQLKNEESGLIFFFVFKFFWKRIWGVMNREVELGRASEGSRSNEEDWGHEKANGKGVEVAEEEAEEAEREGGNDMVESKWWRRNMQWMKDCEMAF